MKTKIVTAVLGVLLTLNAFSFKSKQDVPAQTSSKEIAVNGSLQRLSVADNIQLVLVPGNAKNAVTIAGDAAMMNQVNVSFSKNEMKITSKKHLKQGSIIVYVPAKDLTYVALGSGASVSAQGFLNRSDLTVFLNVGSSVNLTTFGDINLKGADDCDVQYEKLEKMQVVRVAQ